MRRFLLTLSLVAAISIPLAAHAASLTTITISGASGTYTVTVPTIPVSPTEFTGAFEITNVPLTGPSGTPAAADAFFYDLADGGGIQVQTFTGTDILNLGGPVLFTGSLINPSFGSLSGTLNAFLSTDTTVAHGAPFSFTVAPQSVPGVPEPSSLILLGTGALGIVGSLRRRLAA